MESEDALSNRVVALEMKVQEQSTEITLLKSQLCQVLDKLKSAGDGLLNRTTSMTNNNRLKSATPFKSRRSIQPLPSKFEPESLPSIHKSSEFKKPPRPSSASVRRSSISSNSGSTVNMRRSSSNMSLNNVGKSHHRKSISGSVKGSPTYNEADGTVKMHLKGRPVVLYKPTELDYDVTNPSTLPEKKLQLEWVYGYRGKDCRQNIHVLRNGEVVYYTAAVVVLYNPDNSTQRHYNGHNDDVKSLAIHPDQIIAASGQQAGLEHDQKEFKGSTLPIQPRVPKILIWNIETLQTLHTITGFDRAVISVGFSTADGGSHLVAVDDSNDHVLSVWNWAKEHKIAEQKSSKDPVLACQFNPYDDGQIVSCGKGHVAFWTFRNGELVRKIGLFEKNDKPKYIQCVAFDPDGNLLTGDSNGNIQVWSNASRKIKHVIKKVHEGFIYGICYLAEGGFLSTGKDGFVKKYGQNLRPITEKQITDQMCRAIAFTEEGRVYIGTGRNQIMMGSIEDVEPFTTVVEGHYGELWGLATHPTNSCFLTGAYDHQLIYRNSQTHQVEWIKTFDDEIQSADFHPNGKIIAVAMKNGKWIVMDFESHDILTEHTDGKEQHDVIKFSPDGKYLAVGSHDNNIYVYKYDEEEMKFTRHGKCTGHSSYVTHLDWSSDSDKFLTNSGDYEVLAWKAEDCKQITATSSLRDVEWSTQTCTLGFNVIGIWPEGADGTDVNSAGRSKDGTLLATGDDFGKVNLYNYPTIQPQSQKHSFRAHCSHVTSVQFLIDDANVISTGGNDCSVMQWKLV